MNQTDIKGGGIKDLSNSQSVSPPRLFFPLISSLIRNKIPKILSDTWNIYIRKKKAIHYTHSGLIFFQTDVH